MEKKYLFHQEKAHPFRTWSLKYKGTAYDLEIKDLQGQTSC